MLLVYLVKAVGLERDFISETFKAFQKLLEEEIEPNWKDLHYKGMPLWEKTIIKAEEKGA